MHNKKLLFFMHYAALGGNVIFVLWILFNAMNEGFKGTLVQKASAAGLIGLLVLNCYLLLAGNAADKFNEQL